MFHVKAKFKVTIAYKKCKYIVFMVHIHGTHFFKLAPRLDAIVELFVV